MINLVPCCRGFAFAAYPTCSNEQCCCTLHLVYQVQSKLNEIRVLFIFFSNVVDAVIKASSDLKLCCKSLAFVVLVLFFNKKTVFYFTAMISWSPCQGSLGAVQLLCNNIGEKYPQINFIIF